MNIEVRLPRTDEVTDLIEESGVEFLPYSTKWEKYRPSVRPGTVDEHAQLLVELFSRARERYNS